MYRARLAFLLPACASISVFFSGCVPDDGDASSNKRDAILADTDDVRVRIEWTPGVIRYDRDVLADLVVQSPEGIEVHLPPLADRFQGFLLKDSYEEEPIPRDNMRRLRFRFRLSPQAGETLRLAPMPLRIIDPGSGMTNGHWVATAPLRFETESLPLPETDAFTQAEPADIPLSPTMIARKIALALLALAVLLAAIWFSRKYYKDGTSLPDPRELALREIAALLERDDIAQGRFKDFYVEITFIVRRYIERAHGIRAPEQTTPEFLEQAARHPAFSPATLDKLREFLEAADAVKFASSPADPEMAGRAVQNARNYIDSDTDERRQSEEKDSDEISGKDR